MKDIVIYEGSEDFNSIEMCEEIITGDFDKRDQAVAKLLIRYHNLWLEESSAGRKVRFVSMTKKQILDNYLDLEDYLFDDS